MWELASIILFIGLWLINSVPKRPLIKHGFKACRAAVTFAYPEKEKETNNALEKATEIERKAQRNVYFRFNLTTSLS